MTFGNRQRPEPHSDELDDWVLAAVPDGLWVLDDDGVTVFANDPMARMLGLAPDEVVGFSAFRTLDEQGQVDLRAHLDRLREHGEPGADLECLLHRTDGSQFWALVSHAPLVDRLGTHRGWLHRVRNHSREHQLVEELRSRELQLAEAQSITRVGSWERSADERFSRWSDELYRVLEVAPGTVESSSDGFFGLLHPDDRPAAAAAYQRMLAGGPPLDLDLRLDGTHGRASRWVRAHARASFDHDGRLLRVGGTVQDVTETKENEQGLLFLSAMAKAANEASTLADALRASDAVIRPFTPWAAVLVSLPDPGRPGGLRHVETGWGDFDAEELAAARVVAEAAVREQSVVQAPGPSGTQLVAGPALAGDRLACVITADTRANTEPRPFERVIFRQALTLLASVHERERAAAELALARDEALAASRAKSDFLSTMSHEIRTPLNGVIGLSELLSRTELTSHQRRLTQGVDQAGRTLLSLVNDILDLSKIEAGRLDLEEVDFDPRVVVEQSVGLLAGRASAKGIELVVSSADQMPSMVRGDPVRFGQVVTNLVSNAVKFTHEGEVVIRASGEASRPEAVRVEVKDTGIGIPPESRSRLFSAFAQADSSTTRQYGGTGLGLAISERIVIALGGEIGVLSEPGEGSTFWFTAAFAPSTTQEPLSTAALQEAVAGLRVLVVDDNATNRFILTEQLEAWGVEVTAVDSAYAALVELGSSTRTARYDVALLDYMMPGADGEQLARIIRSESRHRHLRLALLSSAIEASPEWLADAGIDTFLSKPVLPSRLLDLLAALGGRMAATRTAVPIVPRAASGSGRGRLLVVEDNPLNQMVAEGVLRRLGYDLVLADNGAIGVAMLADDPEGFDAILMDCQMPVMDGYDATRAVRAMHGDGARIPIIAMTAAATEEERERCLDAGMDDFLTKPVVPDLLESALEQWVPGAREADAGIERLRELVEDGIAPGLVLRMVDRFADSAKDTVGQLAAAGRAGDAAEVARLAHSLRGSSANLGLTGLAERCADLEERGRHGGIPEEEVVDALADAVADAIILLESGAVEFRV